MNKRRSIIYLIITAILWSIGGLFIKLIDWHPFAIAGARSGIEAILIPILEPLLNPIWVFIMTGESPSYFALIGGIIIVSAIVLDGVYKVKKNPKKLIS